MIWEAFLLEMSEQGTQLWMLTMSLILRISHFLNEENNGSHRSEKEIARRAFSCNISILSLINHSIDVTVIWRGICFKLSFFT